jgi:hypothetical protein
VGQLPWLRDTLNSGRQDEESDVAVSLPVCMHAELGGRMTGSQGCGDRLWLIALEGGVTRCAPWHIEAMFKEGREELKVEANSAASN